MEKSLLLISATLLLLYSSTCSSAAAVHTVGENSGWDISTDLDSWSRDKTFAVGDTLLFQYSQYHSVSEVTKDDYSGCNVTKPLESSSNGNTTIALTRPGDRFFVCGNRLHCLGGMKLHVTVVGNETASPAGAPQSEADPSAALPPGSSKTNAPSASSFTRIRLETLVLAFFFSLLILLPSYYLW